MIYLENMEILPMFPTFFGSCVSAGFFPMEILVTKRLRGDEARPKPLPEAGAIALKTKLVCWDCLSSGYPLVIY